MLGSVAGITITTRATVGEAPSDPLGQAVASALADVLYSATVELTYAPTSEPAPEAPTRWARPRPPAQDRRGGSWPSPCGWVSG